jgi:hypothetical protein
MATKRNNRIFTGIEVPKNKEEMMSVFNGILDKELIKQEKSNKTQFNSLKKEIQIEMANKITELNDSNNVKLLQIEKEKDEEVKRLKEEKDAAIKELQKVAQVDTSNYVPLDLQITVSSNVDGTYILSENKGSIDYFIPFNDYKDTAILSYKELKTLNSYKVRNVADGMLAIIEAYTKDGAPFDLNKIYKNLGIDDLYNDKDRISPLEIDYVLSDECDINEFRHKLSNSGGMGEIVLEIASRLKKQGKFNNAIKMDIFRELFGNTNLFR